MGSFKDFYLNEVNKEIKWFRIEYKTDGTPSKKMSVKAKDSNAAREVFYKNVHGLKDKIGIIDIEEIKKLSKEEHAKKYGYPSDQTD